MAKMMERHKTSANGLDKKKTMIERRVDEDGSGDKNHFGW